MADSRGPFSSRQIQTVYEGLMQNNFYDENYNQDSWHPAPYELIAGIIIEALGLKPGDKLRDLGFGAGYMVRAMVDRGIDAIGVEFSPRMFAAAPAGYKDRYRLVDNIDQMDLEGVVAITSLEVFEHLPLSLTVSNLSYLREHFSGDLFLTIPSSGYDRTLLGVGVFEDAPERLADMGTNSFFRYLNYESDVVGAGHILLSSYRWWEDFFLTQGYVRALDKEVALLGYTPQLKAYRWCPYVLNAARLDQVYFGHGWHEEEDGLRWNAAGAQLNLISEASEFRIEMDLILPSLNYCLEPYVDYTVEWIRIVDDYRLDPQVVASGHLSLRHGAGGRVGIDVRRPVGPRASVDPAVEADGAVKAFSAYRIRLHTPLWRPVDCGAGPDERQIGFRFGDMRVQPLG